MNQTTGKQKDSQALHVRLLERLLNDCLALDEGARARLLAMDGGTVTVEVRGTGQRFTLEARGGSCRLRSGAVAAADVTVSGAPLSLLNMMLSDGVLTLFGGGVQLQGDVAVAKRFKRLFDTLDIDWEEHLSSFIGDYPARRAMHALRALGAWSTRSANLLLRDTGDYLNEETRLLSAPAELDDLHDSVDQLRDDAARLAARVARCEHSHDAS